MKQTLQSLKNKQGLQSRFQLRLENLRIRNNTKLQKQRYTLSNFVFASSYNSQFKNSDEIKRLINLSDYGDKEDVYLADLSAMPPRPMTLRMYANMKQNLLEIFQTKTKHTLRSFMLKSTTERYGVSVFFNFFNERKT